MTKLRNVDIRLHEDAARGDDAQVKLDISAGANTNSQDGGGNTPAHKAAGIGTDHYRPDYSGHISTINILRMNGANLHIPNKKGQTVAGHANVMHLLREDYPYQNQGLLSLNYEKVIKALSKVGYVPKHENGSHIKMHLDAKEKYAAKFEGRKPEFMVVVPAHRPIGKSLLMEIISNADLSVNEFNSLL